MANNFGKKLTSTAELEAEEQKKGEDQMGSSMRYDYATAIERKLNELPFVFKSRKVDAETRFELFMHSDRLQVRRVKMIVDENGDFKLRCYHACEVNPQNVQDVKDELNRLNNQFRFISLGIDENRDICSAYDMVLFGEEENAAEQAITTLMLFGQIIDECIPKLLSLAWKTEEGNDRPVNVKTNLFHSEGGAA